MSLNLNIDSSGEDSDLNSESGNERTIKIEKGESDGNDNGNEGGNDEKNEEISVKSADGAKGTKKRAKRTYKLLTKEESSKCYDLRQQLKSIDLKRYCWKQRILKGGNEHLLSAINLMGKDLTLIYAASNNLNDESGWQGKHLLFSNDIRANPYLEQQVQGFIHYIFAMAKAFAGYRRVISNMIAQAPVGGLDPSVLATFNRRYLLAWAPHILYRVIEHNLMIAPFFENNLKQLFNTDDRFTLFAFLQSQQPELQFIKFVAGKNLLPNNKSENKKSEKGEVDDDEIDNEFNGEFNFGGEIVIKSNDLLEMLKSSQKGPEYVNEYDMKQGSNNNSSVDSDNDNVMRDARIPSNRSYKLIPPNPRELVFFAGGLYSIPRQMNNVLGKQPKAAVMYAKKETLTITKLLYMSPEDFRAANLPAIEQQKKKDKSDMLLKEALSVVRVNEAKKKRNKANNNSSESKNNIDETKIPELKKVESLGKQRVSSDNLSGRMHNRSPSQKNKYDTSAKRLKYSSILTNKNNRNNRNRNMRTKKTNRTNRSNKNNRTNRSNKNTKKGRNKTNKRRQLPQQINSISMIDSNDSDSSNNMQPQITLASTRQRRKNSRVIKSESSSEN